MSLQSPLVSVLLPVYNGEKYLEETLNSLLAQSYNNFEVICINDSSSDNSLTILKNYARLDKRFKIFTKPNGGTSAKSVNYGLQFAKGEYFMYSSQDDLFSADLIEKNILRIFETGADVVVPEMYNYFSTNDKSTGIIGVKGDLSKELSGREAFILSLDWTIHGFALWLMNTVRAVGISDYGLNSDEYSTRMLYYNSKKVVFSDGQFFYRQGNPNAITCKWHISQLDYLITCNKIEEFLFQNGFGQKEIEINRKMLRNELIRLTLKFKAIQKDLSKQERLWTYTQIKSAFNENYSKFRDIKKFKSKIITYNWITFDFCTSCFQLLKKAVSYLPVGVGKKIINRLKNE
ncbi:MAG: glycosyltransferase family 2 protein [Mariniphaga sp.]